MKTKSQLRRKADKLWYLKCLRPKCEVCGNVATQVHHFFAKGMYSRLRYNLANGISLCKSCHFRHHNGDPTIHQIIIKKRGEGWYKKLKRIAKKSPSPNYLTKKYYEEIIKKLQTLD